MGDTAELLTQIGELKRVNLSPIEIGLLEAKYLMNCTEWKKAILSLVRLQQLGEQSEESKAQVQDLLAQCYHHLGDRDREARCVPAFHPGQPEGCAGTVGTGHELSGSG